MANMSLGLQELREVFRDDRLHLALGVITQLSVADDRSYLKAMVNTFPDEIQMICTLSWDAVGPDAGIFQFPSVNDLVIVGYIDGSENDAYILSRCTSGEDKIPIQALGGHLVLKALAGKKSFVNSDTEINLTREGPGDERVVLGDTFKTAYSKDLDETAKHQHMGNLGYLTSVPNNAVEFTTLKASPVDDAVMLSDIAKTEK